MTLRQAIISNSDHGEFFKEFTCYKCKRYRRSNDAKTHCNIELKTYQGDFSKWFFDENEKPHCTGFRNKSTKASNQVAIDKRQENLF